MSQLYNSSATPERLSTSKTKDDEFFDRMVQLSDIVTRLQFEVDVLPTAPAALDPCSACPTDPDPLAPGPLDSDVVVAHRSLEPGTWVYREPVGFYCLAGVLRVYARHNMPVWVEIPAAVLR